MLRSKDANENFRLDLSTGQMTVKKGSINLGYNSSTGTYKFSVNDSGTLNCSGANISGTLTTESGNRKTVLSSGFANYYWGSTNVGHIGTNQWSNNNSLKGLTMDLEYDADFIGWFYKASSGASNYSPIMYWSRDDDEKISVTKDLESTHAIISAGTLKAKHNGGLYTGRTINNPVTGDLATFSFEIANDGYATTLVRFHVVDGLIVDTTYVTKGTATPISHG